MSERIETVEQLRAVALHSVLVDRVGMAWQAIQLGEDWSAHKGGRDFRRIAFIQAGNHIHFEAERLASVLPMRVVDDGQPEPAPAPEPTSTEKLLLFSGEMQ